MKKTRKVRIRWIMCVGTSEFLYEIASRDVEIVYGQNSVRDEVVKALCDWDFFGDGGDTITIEELEEE